MAKKDNPSTETEAPVEVAPIAAEPAKQEVEVTLAPLALADRVAELEKKLNVQPQRTKTGDIPLHVCNQRHREVMTEVRGERRDVVAQVTKALTAALGGGRQSNEHRVQKDIARHVAEAKATK